MSSNSSNIIATVASTVESIRNFTFGIADYVVFVLLLCVSAGIGVYFGFFAKSKNTTDEYLMGGKKMKSFPIAISLVARLVSFYMFLKHLL